MFLCQSFQSCADAVKLVHFIHNCIKSQGFASFCDAEENRIQRLQSGAEDWHRARRIREYVLALVDCKKEQGTEFGPDTALGKWMTWALQQADRIDPLIASPPSILDRKRELDGWSPYGWR